jgi:hypothetical protein
MAFGTNAGCWLLIAARWCWLLVLGLGLVLVLAAGAGALTACWPLVAYRCSLATR